MVVYIVIHCLLDMPAGGLFSSGGDVMESDNGYMDGWSEEGMIVGERTIKFPAPYFHPRWYQSYCSSREDPLQVNPQTHNLP